MGMYTELVLSVNIKDDADVVPILQHMCKPNADKKPALPDHPLFESGRWEWMFHNSSYYHVPRAHASFEYDEIGRYWTLIVRCDFKNYDDEITKFVDWIAPYVEDYDDDKQMIGYSRYEEDVEPKILYAENRYDPA